MVEILQSTPPVQGAQVESLVRELRSRMPHSAAKNEKKKKKLMTKVRHRELLNAAREKQGVNYKGTPIRLPAIFSTKTLQARTE